MPSISIWRSNMMAARARCVLNDEENALLDDILSIEETSNIPVEVSKLPVEFARALLEDGKLKPNQRAALAFHVHGMRGEDEDLRSAYDIVVGNPVDFGSVLLALQGGRANAEIQWNGRWYPVQVLAEMREDENKLVKHVSVSVVLGMGQCTRDISWAVDPMLFVDSTGKPVERTVLDVLRALGFEPLRMTPREYNLRLMNAERMSADFGKQVWVRGSVVELQPRFWHPGHIGELALGTVEMPRRAIVDTSLEARDGDYGYRFGSFRNVFDMTVSRLPMVRVFSIDLKRYVFVDVDDLTEYDYDATAMDRLYLPAEMKAVLRQVFETPSEQLFGDLIRGQHGGIVVMACGSPGVGKTLTAEVYAEVCARPLYPLEFGELGTTVEQIENNLDLIFGRVVRWNAVLQFDECEVFLGERDADLERSAIVAIFLRMLDYYEGLLFLTTNRPEVIDNAILSRVMLRLEYPDLDATARAGVWRTMLTAAGLTLVGGDFERLARTKINGRQVRNYVRLAKILYPDGQVTGEQMETLFAYGVMSVAPKPTP